MNQIKYYFTTSHDGNLAYHVPDIKENVDKNREAVALLMEYKNEDLVYMNQVHGNNVQIVDKNSPKLIENCDGLITKEKELPLYICTFDNSEKVYIVPVHGAGLWGPIWGYVALQSDFNTIYGATFDHKGETPGLGADINTTWFGGQFTGKQIFKDGEFCSVEVVKGGADKSNPHQVDAISGGTITSKGLEKMLLDSFGDYLDFFKSRLVTASAPVATDSLSADSLKTATPDSSAVKQNIK